MDIYAINDTLIDRLTKNKLIVPISKLFNSCATNAGKVQFLEELLNKYEMIPKIDARHGKNNNQSKELRQKGNTLFGRGKPFEALELYNQSICWADTEHDAEELAIGYANRSAVYHKWKMFEFCRQNVELAKNAGYPKRLMEKLVKREMDCLEQINNQVVVQPDEVRLKPKLHMQANPQIPFIANCLEMKESKDQGRYVTTNIELNPGEVIAIEEPYAVCLQPSSRYQRCNYCLTENALNLIPCPCCTNAMFCSEKCMNRANDEYHRIECPISDFLLQLFNKLHTIALRVSLKAVNSFHSTNEMTDFCREMENANFTTFSFNHVNKLSPLEHYQQVHCLATNEDKRKPSDLFQRATIAAVMWIKLMEHTKLAEILPDSESRSAFMEILFRHLQTAPTNFHTLDLAETPLMEVIEYAHGAYPFCSLLNHSCAPNICRMSVGRKMVVFALRVVRQGEQLFDNYGYHHSLMTKDKRQSSLNFQYNFSCNCSACCFDYPTIMELRESPQAPNIHSSDDIEKLTELNLDFVSRNMQRFCQYLKEYDNLYPCKQIAEAQENLKLCYHILVENYSFKVKSDRF